PSDPNVFNGVTWHNYGVNFGGAGIYQGLGTQPGGVVVGIYPDALPWRGAPFSDADSTQRNYPSRARCYGLESITDGTSHTLMAGEVVKGKNSDLRGFTWWGDAASIGTYQSPNSSLADRINTSVENAPLWCVPDQGSPPCFMATEEFPSVYAFRSRHPGGV